MFVGRGTSTCDGVITLRVEFTASTKGYSWGALYSAGYVVRVLAIVRVKLAGTQRESSRWVLHGIARVPGMVWVKALGTRPHYGGHPTVHESKKKSGTPEESVEWIGRLALSGLLYSVASSLYPCPPQTTSPLLSGQGRGGGV